MDHRAFASPKGFSPAGGSRRYRAGPAMTAVGFWNRAMRLSGGAFVGLAVSLPAL